MLPRSFETERLSLRLPTPADAQAIFESYVQDPEVTRYLPWRPHQSPADTVAFIEVCQRCARGGTDYHYVVLNKPGQSIIGSFHIDVRGHEASFGYTFAKSCWGQGFATEALTAGVAWALSQDVIQRVWATCDVDNRGSARVMEKAGLTFEARLPKHAVHPNLSPEPRDSLLYSRRKSI